MRMQLVAFFNSAVVESGFSEVYHLEIGTYADASAAASSLLGKRLAMMCEDIALHYARVSDIDVKGDSRLVSEINYPAPGTFAPGEKSEPLSNAVLVRQEATELHRGMREVRAIPDSVLDGQKYKTVLGWEAAFTDWKDKLRADPWRLKVKDPAGVGGVSLLAITELTNLKQVTHRNVGRPFGTAHGRRRPLSPP